MKKLVLSKSVMAVMVFMFTLQLTMAGVHDPKKTSDLKMIMQKQLEYPAYAQENNMTGFVVVAFEVTNEGKILITQINSNLSYFQEYVTDKLQEMVLKNPQNYQGSSHYFRFDFQLLYD